MGGEILKRRSIARRKLSVEDKKREGEITALVQQIAAAGFVVRREELKRGSGWKASSGSCRVVSDRVVFVDRRLPLNEQMLFLSEFLKSHAAISSFATESDPSSASNQLGPEVVRTDSQ